MNAISSKLRLPELLLLTTRLELVAGTVQLAQAEIDNLPSLAQLLGYATEAVRALLSWAFQHPAVQRVVADTLPGLTPSIRVMEKSGFAFVGDGPVEDGMRTIRYELTRERFQAVTSE
jgi:RimJ/RimL family protein N-acetyltransferase